MRGQLTILDNFLLFHQDQRYSDRLSDPSKVSHPLIKIKHINGFVWQNELLRKGN